MRRRSVVLGLDGNLDLVMRLTVCQYFWRERAAFAVSTAVLFTLAQENPQKIRGVLGQVLQRVLD